MKGKTLDVSTLKQELENPLKPVWSEVKERHVSIYLMIRNDKAMILGNSIYKEFMDADFPMWVSNKTVNTAEFQTISTVIPYAYCVDNLLESITHAFDSDIEFTIPPKLHDISVLWSKEPQKMVLELHGFDQPTKKLLSAPLALIREKCKGLGFDVNLITDGREVQLLIPYCYSIERIASVVLSIYEQHGHSAALIQVDALRRKKGWISND